MPSKPGICGLILAGGTGRRMGGVDKGLQMLRGRRMVEWVLERLRPQVDAAFINANQNLQNYESLGVPVFSDAVREGHGGFAGPLAGLHAGLTRCEHEYLVSAPCDSPFLPGDLVRRLLCGLQGANAQLAVAKTGSQVHPVFALMRVEVRDHLADFLNQHGRKIDAWYASLSVVEVAFDDEAAAFSNINTREELRQWEASRAEAAQQ